MEKRAIWLYNQNSNPIEHKSSGDPQRGEKLARDTSSFTGGRCFLSQAVRSVKRVKISHAISKGTFIHNAGSWW